MIHRQSRMIPKINLQLVTFLFTIRNFRLTNNTIIHNFCQKLLSTKPKNTLYARTQFLILSRDKFQIYFKK